MSNYIFSDDLQGKVVLEKGKVYELSDTIELSKPTHLDGQGAILNIGSMTGIHITSSDVRIENLTINGAQISVYVENTSGVLENINIENCKFQEYHIAGVMGGASESDCLSKDITIKNCAFYSAKQKKDGVSCNDIMFAAAIAGNNVENGILDGFNIQNCKLCGQSVCNIFMLPGISMNQSTDISFTNCIIRNILIDGCTLTGAYDTSIAIQANLINNMNCGAENVVVKNCTTDIGITGISASSGSPLKGDCHGSYFKGFKCIGNTIFGSDRVGEEMSAINISAGEIDYYSDARCYDSYICDVEIRDNYIHDCERGINIHAVYSIIDAEESGHLEGNYVENVVVENNRLKDVDTCFMLLGAWIDGRRLDWHLGNEKKTQFWLPRFENHEKTSFVAKDNYVRNLRCENNMCDGYKVCVLASGAFARGNSVMTGNRIDENIIFQNNTFINGEDHIKVADTILEDWVRDGGGNKVSDAFRDFKW